MTIGFIVLSLSGVALGVAATGDSAWELIPSLLLLGRRSRWVHANVGETPAVSRVPPEALDRRTGASAEHDSAPSEPSQSPG